jgi:hypothetical protein
MAKRSDRDMADCRKVSRRRFLQGTAAGAAAAISAPLVTRRADGAPSPSSRSETLAAQLFHTLDAGQRERICFPFDHPLRSRVDNNWHVTSPTLADLFTREQQAVVKELFLGLHSEEYADIVYRQVDSDSGSRGFYRGSSVAFFGEPGTGRFEFVLTGRHCTRRCDGDSVRGAAFGGPIFYGHAARSYHERPDHPGNAYWYQAKRANEAFQSLDGRQRELALHPFARREAGAATVKLTGRTSGLPGIPVSELSADQAGLVRDVMTDLLAPFRPEDAREAMKIVEAGGFEHLHMAFYKNRDLGNDGVWDVWQLEGPNMVWFFRGDPHVHVWVHVADSKTTTT